jgi:tryptophanyl-tRNA synthetase
MSKSSPDPRSRILLTDSYETIRKKIGGAVTDSIREVYWDEERKGVCNLVTILAGCSSSSSTSLAALSPEEDTNRLEEAIKRCKGLDHARLKSLVIEAVEETLKGPRAEYARIRAEPDYLESVLKEGANTARSVAEGTSETIKRGLGLLL